MNLSPFYRGHFDANKEMNQEHKYFEINFF